VQNIVYFALHPYMNFLSHYYFDRHTSNCYQVLGTVLPDLVKNADKTTILHPEKLNYPTGPAHHICNGWHKHLEVDRQFHNSAFFKTHSHQLKLHLREVVEGSPVKPFFLGHIALELILDNLLLTTGQLTADGFYSHLDSCEHEAITDFLTRNGMKDPAAFIHFFEKFKHNQYLHTYAETGQVAYALKRICMRIWNNPFTPKQEEDINKVITNYRETLKPDFMSIFEEIAILTA
jgi:acyl carrier protein phosphodiesterase